MGRVPYIVAAIAFVAVIYILISNYWGPTSQFLE